MVYIDESGFELNGRAGYTWASVGQTPYLTSSCAYQRLSAISAITPCGKLFFHIKEKSYKGADIIEFLVSLYAFLGQKMLIIWDGASIHKSKKVHTFVTDNDQFYTHHLPPYSPELNPDELVWADLKTNKLKSHIDNSLGGLRTSLENALKDLQEEEDKIKSFFRKKSIHFFY